MSVKQILTNIGIGGGRAGGSGGSSGGSSAGSSSGSSAGSIGGSSAGSSGGSSAGRWWCLYKSVMCNCIYTKPIGVKKRDKFKLHKWNIRPILNSL